MPLAEARTIADTAAPRWHGACAVEPSVVVEGQPRTQYYTRKDQTGRQLISSQMLLNDPFYITGNEPVALPSRCQIHREVHQTTIKLRWLTSFTYFLLLSTIAWDAAVIVTATQSDFFWLLLLLDVWIAIGLAYMVVRGFVNSTHITIATDCVQVDQHPLKACCCSGPTIVTFAKNGYEEVRVKQILNVETGDTDTWEVHILDLESGTFTNVPMLVYCSKEEALFVAQEVRKHLTPGPTAASAPTEIGIV